MHAIHRTAPVPRPRVGRRAAGEAATNLEPFEPAAPAGPAWPSGSSRPSGSARPSGRTAPSEPREPFDWAVEEPDWADATGPATTPPDWWLRDRPILATPPPSAPTGACFTDRDTTRQATTATEFPNSDVTTATSASEPATSGVTAATAAATSGVAAATTATESATSGVAAATGPVASNAATAARGAGAMAVVLPTVGEPAGDRRVRLTRRGRLVVVGLAAALLLGAFWIGTRAVSAASTTAGTEVAYVQNGDTLWAVAERARPGVDPRDTVARIRDINGLQGTLVQPGQRLVLPAR